MVKLIFLDLDGVLVTRRPGTFEDPLLQNLKRLVDDTGAKIVLSSDWRRHPCARAGARQFLQKADLDFIGHTPCMSPALAQRPTEIMTWKQGYLKKEGMEPITHWVAIDDRELLAERHGKCLVGHFVRTHPLRGLTEPAVEQCKQILNSNAELPQARPKDDMMERSMADTTVSLPPLGQGRRTRGASTPAGCQSRLGASAPDVEVRTTAAGAPRGAWARTRGRSAGAIERERPAQRNERPAVFA